MSIPGGIVCYVTRSGSGSMIRGLRLVAAGLAREWTAPEAQSVSSVDSDGPSPAVGAARAGAEFIAQTLAQVGMKRLSAVCLDADGAVCAWLSAPSPEASIVRATIEQSSLEADASGAGVGAARLLSLSTAAPGTGSISDVSVQALATPSRGIEGGRAAGGAGTGGGVRGFASRLRPGKSVERAPASKERYAVLAVPDAPVRVLIDELDARGIEIGAVVTLWHAMASGWDPGAGEGESAPPTAVVLVEPEGRLVWSWSRGGELLAGGTMRLSTFSARAEPGKALAPVDGGAAGGGAPAHAGVSVDFSVADAGRLAMDWLAWSAQLGQCPRRVVCLASPNTGSSASGDGPAVLGRLLARVWPGTTIDAVVHADAVGATLGRLAGLGPRPSHPSTAETNARDALPPGQRPRSALTDLSTRPGRADRAQYRWAAGAMVALALLVGATAWQIYRSVDAVRERAADAIKQRSTVLDELRVLVKDDNLPRLGRTQLDDRLAGAQKQLQDVLKVLRPPRPVLDETARLLEALDGIPGVKLTEYEINTVLARATLLLPAPGDDASPEEIERSRSAGPTVLERLRDSPGVLAWKGEAPAFSPQGQRRYMLTALWPEKFEPVKRTPRSRAAPPSQTPAVPGSVPTDPGENPATTPEPGQTPADTQKPTQTSHK